MKVLYDYQAFLMQTHGGVSKCFSELITQLPSSNIEVDLGVIESNNIHLLEKKIKEIYPCENNLEDFLWGMNFKGKNHIYRMVSDFVPFYNTSLKTNRKYVIEKMLANEYDIFHPTFFDDYFLKYLKGKPFVLTIHDMTPELFPYYYRKKDFQIVKKRKLAKLAEHIVTVSQQTKNDVVELLDIPSDRISVIYHGAPEVNLCKEKKLIDCDYILFVGGRSKYKNFIPFIESSIPFFREFPNVKLVCTGNKFSVIEKKMIQKYGLTDQILNLFVNDRQLRNLYENAIAFVYPSLYEGFGIPILEAFVSGCPVILNKKSCFPEIAGEAAIYFDLDENNRYGIFESLKEVYTNIKLRRTLIEKGYQRAKLYSWENSAKQLSSVYNKIFG